MSYAPQHPISSVKPASRRNPRLEPAIRDLERGGALSSYQAERLLKLWPDLDDDWAVDPCFGTVREHSRAYLDQLRHQSNRSPERS
jgi:hypothetical protein